MINIEVCKTFRDNKEQTFFPQQFRVLLIFAFVVCNCCFPYIICAQDNLARANEIVEQINTLGEQIKNCKDTECTNRLYDEMTRLGEEALNIVSEESDKMSNDKKEEVPQNPEASSVTHFDGSGKSSGKTNSSSPRPSAPRRYSSDSEYLQAQYRCEPWIDHLQRWCIEEPNPSIRDVNCESAAQKMCVPANVTMRARIKSYHYDIKCGQVREEFYHDYTISSPGVMWYSSDFSNFDLVVWPVGWRDGYNPFHIEINDAHGFTLDTEYGNRCKIVNKYNFTKSDICYQNNITPYFELKINYPSETKHLNLVYVSKVFLTFAGYKRSSGDVLNLPNRRIINKSFQPKLSYFVTPDIMRRSLSEKNLRHTFHLRQDESGLHRQIYRDTTLDMDIAFGPFDCGGNNDNNTGSVAYSGSCTEDGGIVIGRRGTVFVNGKPIARAGDRVFSTFNGMVEITSKLNYKVFVEGKPVAMVGDVTTKGVKIVGGSRDTFVGQ